MECQLRINSLMMMDIGCTEAESYAVRFEENHGKRAETREQRNTKSQICQNIFFHFRFQYVKTLVTSI